jgi:hypothetical protein
MTNFRQLMFIGVTLACALGVSVSAVAGEREPFAATVQTTVSAVFPGSPGYDASLLARCHGGPALKIAGAGDASFLGVITDEQSNCQGANGQFTDGVFRFTDAHGRTIIGQYSGRLVPTFNADLSTVPPTGAFVVFGQACISGGTRFAHITDDCAAHRYSPVRGLTNIRIDGTGDAVIFLQQTIGVSEHGEP